MYGSYGQLGCRENISTSQVIMFCSYGETFFRLPGTVSRCDVDFVKCKQKVFPLSGKVVFIWGKNYLGQPDLACQQGTRENFSSQVLFTWAEVISVTEKTFRQVYKRDLALLWNNMKSCIAFVWDEKFSRVPRSRLLTGEISVTEIIFIPYEHNFPV